jgi:hypothetical protein
MNGLLGWFAGEVWKWEWEAAPEGNLILGRIKPERSREKKPWLAKYL